MSVLAVSSTGYLVHGDKRLLLDPKGCSLAADARFLCVSGTRAFVGYLGEVLAVDLPTLSVVARAAMRGVCAGLQGELLVSCERGVVALDAQLVEKELKWRVGTAGALAVVGADVYLAVEKRPVHCSATIDEGVPVREPQTYFRAIEASRAPLLFLGDSSGKVAIWTAMHGQDAREGIIAGEDAVLAFAATPNGALAATADGRISEITAAGQVKPLYEWPIGFTCAVEDAGGLLLGDAEGAVHRYAAGKLSRVAELSPELAAVVLVART